MLLGVFHLFVSALGVVFDTDHGFSLWQVGLTSSRLWVDIVIAACTDLLWYRKMFDGLGFEEWTGVRLRLSTVYCPLSLE